MRIFRVTLNPLDPFVLAGPNGNSLVQRLPFHLTNRMLYVTLKDGCYVRVPDADMGEFGPAIDGLQGMVGGGYRIFQDSVVPEGAQESDIPLWTSQLVPLVQPPAQMPAPTAWPVLNVVVNPVPG